MTDTSQEIVQSGSQGLQLHNPAHISEFAKTLTKFVKDNQLSMEIQGNEYVLVDGWKFAGMNFGLTAIASEPEQEDKGATLYIIKKWTKVYNQNKYWWKPVGVTQDTTIVDLYTAQNDKAEKEWEAGDKKKKYQRPYDVVATSLYKFKCNVDVIRVDNGQKVGFGSAKCSNEEMNKITFEEYAVFSMAQTRAIGKAYRNLLGFMMKAAGYADTPAEEMTDQMGQQQAQAAAETAANDGVPQEVLDKIEAFDELFDLLEWSTDECAQYHQNKAFRAAVAKKKAQLEKDSE